MKTKKRICAVALVCAAAICTLSIGLASWSTTVNGSGNVAAAGSWDVSVTDASLNLSTGASATTEVTTYALTRTGDKADSYLAASIMTPTTDESLSGTQSTTAMSWATYYYAVDTSEFDLSDLLSLTTDDLADIKAADSTVTISDELNMFYYVSGSGSAAMSVQYTNVIDGLLRDTEALLRERYPDTYQNYELVCLGSGKYVSKYTCYKLAKMTATTETVEEAAISADGATVTYADVTFGLPGAWAQYSLTVTNNGTANANLADAVIALDTESDQLVLDAPDLSDETLAPGESCTITVVVKVPSSVTDDLDASGTLTITLPYSQDTVEEAPSSSHTH